MITVDFGGERWCSMTNFITVKEATARLKVTNHVIYNLISRGFIKAFKPVGITSAWKIDESSLEKYIESKVMENESFPNSINKIFENVKNGEEYKDLLLYRYAKGYPTTQIKELLNISETTYHIWENKALKIIRDNIKKISYNNVKDNQFALKLIVRVLLGDK
jgi:excisionase family DNA binding protein